MAFLPYFVTASASVICGFAQTELNEPRNVPKLFMAHEAAGLMNFAAAHWIIILFLARMNNLLMLQFDLMSCSSNEFLPMISFFLFRDHNFRRGKTR